MLRTTFFYCDCARCGRPLRVRVEYLGKRVGCSHCGGEFTADEQSTNHSAQRITLAIEKADQLLSQINEERGLESFEIPEETGIRFCGTAGIANHDSRNAQAG